MVDQAPARGGFQARVYDVFEASDAGGLMGRVVDLGLIVLIAVNVVAVILETVPEIYARYGPWFDALEIFSVVVFSLEYGLRAWSCVADGDQSRSDGEKRLAHLRSPIAIIDLLAILPFYLAFFVSIDLRFLRVLRLLRIFKLTRYSSAMTMLLDVLRQEASSFFAAIFVLVVLLILAASGAYLVEHQAQPEDFGSIPAAMWWAVATLTTVGYGDVSPVTMGGKIFGALIMIIGIGMAALPAGILASGLADQLRRKREALAHEYDIALADGVIDEHEHRALSVIQEELGLSDEAATEILERARRARRAEAASPTPGPIPTPGDVAPEGFACPHCGGRITR